LLPHQINGNIDESILENLTKKVKGKTMAHGIVIKIHRMIDYNYGIIDKTNFMGTTVYSVKYECLLCSPIKNLEIVCAIHNIVTGFIIGQNGPVTVAIQLNNIDKNKFDVTGDTVKHIATKKIITKQDYIRVSIININSNLGEHNIMTICKLIDIANERDIERFKEDNLMISDENFNDNSVFI